jgi:voltage-gated potassium channel
VAPGEYVFHAGETGHEMFFISRGRLEVLGRDGKTLLDTLSDGEIFGEMALLSGQSRNASVRATDYCDLYTLDKETFDRIMEGYPEFAQHIGQLTDRRRQTNH